MKRLSRIFSRSKRKSPNHMKRDETQEDFLRSDDSDSGKEEAKDRMTPIDLTDFGTDPDRKRLNSAATSIASAKSHLDRQTSTRLRVNLYEAVSNDSVDELKEVLNAIKKLNFSLDIEDFVDPDNGMTVLHTALEERKLQTARHLIETQEKDFLQAFYINMSKQIPPSRKTSLHIAAEVGNKELTEMLLGKLSAKNDKLEFSSNWLRTTSTDFKSDMVVVKKDGDRKRRVTAIHLAAMNGHAELISLMLSYGFDIDCEDSESETPLALAVQMGHLETAKQLIALKAGVDHANAYGCTPLHLAISLGRKDMVRLLITEGHADVDVERIKSPKSPIEMAANRCEMKMVKHLLKAKPEIKLELRHQALMIAANKGNFDIVKEILESDLDKLINRPDDNGNTALLVAAEAKRLPIVKYFVSQEADLYWKNHARQTVFDIAMQQSNNTLLQYLLEIYKFKRGELKKEGFYLHVAAANGDIEKIKYLCSIGIDLYALDELHNTFLHTAAFHNRSNVLDHFVTPEDDFDTLKNSEGETPIHIAAKRGYVECVRVLLEKKSRLDLADKQGHTPLHAALCSKAVSSRIVAALVETIKKETNPAILNEQDIIGRTALHLAAAGKRPEILKLLTDLDPEIENKEGDTPLHVAAELGTIEVLRMYVEEFCSRGKRGKIDHKDVHGLSALHRCVMVADADKVEVMLHSGSDLSLTNEDGKTVLHTIVDTYKLNPTLDERLVKVYRTIVSQSTAWYCWKYDMKTPKEESKEFYLTQLDAVRLLTSQMYCKGMNAIQYASIEGAGEILREILNTPNVYRFNRNSPLQGTSIDEGNALLVENKHHKTKRWLLMMLRQGDVLFDVSYLVPGVMPKPDNILVDNAISKSGRVERNSNTSCIEYIVNEGDEDLAVNVLSVEPFSFLVSNYWKFCRRTYEALMWIHVIFMVCFTYFLMPSTAWLHWRFGTNSSTVDPEEYAVTSGGFYPQSVSGIFLLWPVFNLFHSFICAVHFLFRMNKITDICDTSMIRKLHIGEITSGLLRIPIGILLFIFDNLSQISALAFGGSFVAWYIMFIHADNAHRYLECLGMAYIFGWLHTISFVKGFKDWNAMAAILKQVILKDITRFIYIYIFILISFGYAIHAIIQADYHLDPEYRSSSSTIYLTFYRMLSPGNVLDVSEDDDYKNSGGSVSVLRAVCSAYSILTSVVLMNMLIAMMNSTYSDVKSEKSTAWRFESLRMAIWVEKHFPLRRFKFLRLKRTLYDNSQNRWFLTYKPEDEREVWGCEKGFTSELEDVDEEEKEEEIHDSIADKMKVIDAMKSEIGQLREELQARKEDEEKIVKYVTELKAEVKLIHELCRETSHIVRIRQESK